MLLLLSCSPSLLSVLLEKRSTLNIPLYTTHGSSHKGGAKNAGLTPGFAFDRKTTSLACENFGAECGVGSEGRSSETRMTTSTEQRAGAKEGGQGNK